jgi:hypothetical protein
VLLRCEQLLAEVGVHHHQLLLQQAHQGTVHVPGGLYISSAGAAGRQTCEYMGVCNHAMSCERPSAYACGIEINKHDAKMASHLAPLVLLHQALTSIAHSGLLLLPRLHTAYRSTSHLCI